MEEKSRAELVAAALKKKEEENSHLQPVVQAFGKVLIEQARWKATLADCSGCEIPGLDPERLAEGIPLTDPECLARLGEMWPVAAERIIPSLAEGFPEMGEGLGRLQAAIANGDLSPDLFLGAAYGQRRKEAAETASRFGFEPEILVFVLTQLAKPVMEKRSEALQPLLDGIAWNRGYCPVCGSFPEMSMLAGKEGKRRLRCGFCSGTWHFYRMSCPCCEDSKPEDLEIFFVEGQEHESVEVCHKCKRYVPGIDLRSFADEGVLEVMVLGLMHLDAVAQSKGFLPMRGTVWKDRAEMRAGTVH